MYSHVFNARALRAAGTTLAFFNARRAASSVPFLLGSCIGMWLAEPNSSLQGFPKNRKNPGGFPG